MPQADGVADVQRLSFRNYTHARAREELTDVAAKGRASKYIRGEIFVNFMTAIVFCEWPVRGRPPNRDRPALRLIIAPAQDSFFHRRSSLMSPSARVPHRSTS